MSTGLHKDLEIAEIHRAHSLSYANASARTGATGLTADDVGRDAIQTDDNSFWRLTNHSPVTWIQLGVGGTDDDAIHGNVAGEIAAITEKASPVSADLIIIEDSADSNNKKRVQLANLPAAAAEDAESLIVSVLKGSAGTINPGQTVYITGYNVGLGVPEVELADASSASTMPAFGIARDTITNAATGEVVVSGELTGQNTSSWSVGDAIYVSETTGALTNTKPTGTALIQKIAQVTRSNVSVGVLQVFGAGRSNDVPNIAENNVWMGNASGVATATSRDGLDRTAIHDDTASEISAVTEKTSPVAADLALIEDSADSNNKKRIQLGNIPIAVSQASATASTTITSTTPTVINSMTITPGAGDYVAFFSSYGVTDAGGDQVFYGIYSNGSQVTHSVRRKDADDANVLYTQAYITGLGASQAIDARGWNESAGKTSTIYERSLILVKVG